jgi:hydrogenase expression/formation protein HypC
MCLGVPARIVEIGDDDAVVELGGVVREASLMLLDDVEIGDWVILHAGFAIEKLDPEEARRTLALFKEITHALP